MSTDVPAQSTEILAADACWALLRTVAVGRLAVVAEGNPEIFPINFVVDHGSVVFRTAEGTKAAAALSGARVAFESDGTDTAGASAWSVVLKGLAATISRPTELLDTFDLPLHPWQAGTKDRFIRITPDLISGRRFDVVDSASWRITLDDTTRAGLE